MGRLITISCIVLLTSCASNRVHTVYTKEYIPVNVVPMPPEVTRPVLETSLLTEEQKKDSGEMVKAYKIALIQSLGYISSLEKIVQTYTEMAIESSKDFNILARLNGDSQTGPLSAGSPKDVTFTEVIKARDFNFEYEMRNWKNEQKLKKLQDEINTLNNTNYKPNE